MATVRRGQRPGSVALPDRLRKFQPVVVTWEDARSVYDHSDSDEIAEEFEAKPCIRRSIGFAIGYSRTRIVLAMEDDRGASLPTDCQTITTIPRGMIVDITRL